MSAVAWLGSAAALASTISFTPQAWKIIKTGETKDISTGMYVITVGGFAMWAAYGALLRQWPLVASNSICGAVRLHPDDEAFANIENESGGQDNQEESFLKRSNIEKQNRRLRERGVTTAFPLLQETSMSLIDKVIAAVTPPESNEARAEARAKAFAVAEPDDWLSLVLEHHLELEAAVAAVEDATDVEERADAFKEFAVLLTGHAIAEEGVLYPALADNSQTGHADMGYGEQAMVKMQMAALEKLDPMGQEFEDKLSHVKGALQHHMYEEEGGWFLDLKQKASAEDQETLTSRYAEEFDRYVGGTELLAEDDDEEE